MECFLKFAMEKTYKNDKRVVYMKPECNTLDLNLSEMEKKKGIQSGYYNMRDYFNERKHTDS